MSQFIIRFLLIAFLFGSAEAAVDSVHIDIDHEEGSGHLIHDEHKSNNDNEVDSCDHYCHCHAQLGMIHAYSLPSLKTYIINKIPNDYSHRFRPLPPLFRPPIT
jgi:hypothetical protein